MRLFAIPPLRGHAPWLTAGGLALSTLTAPVFAQLRYVDRPALEPRRYAGLAFDAARGRAVLLGGDAGLSVNAPLGQAWEREAGAFTPRPTPVWPAGEAPAALAYDPIRGRVVHFAFHITTAQPETWGYDGRGWSRFAGVANNPPYRRHYASAFDARRGMLVLFGGRDQSGALQDTWEFNGLDWQQVAMSGPLPRSEAAMTWDGTRQRILLFGGRGPTQQTLGDMWEWDGNAWTNSATTTMPTARHSARAAYDADRNRVLMFGGIEGATGNRSDETWEWNGLVWALRTPTHRPTPRAGHAMTYDLARHRMVVAVGEDATGLLADVWEWDGNDWREAVAAGSPTARSEHATCFDSARGEVVLFGGKDAALGALADTWAWRLGSWRRLSPATSPSARSEHAMAFDAARGQTVLFGGNGASALADTWLFDGTTWTQANPTSSPPARAAHAMVFDSTRQVIVMFGGDRGGITLDDLWEWNGTTWTARTPAQRPGLRKSHGMAYDPARGETIVFGGRNAIRTPLNDTWIWDGAAGTWTQRIVTPMPAARDNFAMGYDPVRQRTMLFSGFGTSAYLPDTWEWDGLAWRAVFAFPLPTARQGMALAFDTVSKNGVLSGGVGTGGRSLQETWLLTSNPLAGVVAHGAPCPGASGISILTGFGQPTVGATGFALDMFALPPTALRPVFLMLTANAGSVTIGTCTLAVDPATHFYTELRWQVATGFSSVALPIPGEVRLLGAQFYAVAAYTDPPTPFYGLAFSQQVRVVIGD